ncbi:MAG: P-loop ATPase, Sll1717 family [Halobacteriota archaeon]
MVSENMSILKSVLTHAEPLGPIDQARILEDAAKALLDDQVTPFTEVIGKPYMLLLGRKGSGKSAILTDMRLKLHPSRRPISIPDRLPKKGESYVIPVMSWEHFHQITRNVAMQFRADDLLADIVPPEHYTSLWYEMLWDEMIQHFFNYSHFPEARVALAPINGYINADKPFQGPADKEAERLFSAARESILDFLTQRSSKVYFLFDSMENYPVRNTIFSRVLTGLFQALNKINSESAPVRISFCIPEEIEGFLASSSANLLKDFASSYRIRWRPIDLLRIAAHRFRLATAIYDNEFYAGIRNLDFSRREHIHQLFSTILPKSVHNSLGHPEDPLTYIIRHTQLLPRHVLAIFNAILSRNHHLTGGFRKVDESAIREGINHVQQIIAMQILYPYERLYPKLIAACREILPDLDPICSFNNLKKIEGRFKRRIEDDVISVWTTLFQMGVIGLVGEHSSVRSSSGWQSERYCYGHFHFNIDGSFGMATDSEYCFHPVFRRAFGIVRRGSDNRVVYPANIDMITLT